MEWQRAAWWHVLVRSGLDPTPNGLGELRSRNIQIQFKPFTFTPPPSVFSPPTHSLCYEKGKVRKADRDRSIQYNTRPLLLEHLLLCFCLSFLPILLVHHIPFPCRFLFLLPSNNKHLARSDQLLSNSCLVLSLSKSLTFSHFTMAEQPQWKNFETLQLHAG